MDPSLEGASSEKPSRRADRVGLRRRELGHLATQLLQERGYGALSVNEVAERASMSIGGLYRYISKKSDLLEMAIDEINLSLYEKMVETSNLERGVTARLVTAFRVYWETCWDTAGAILIAYREWGSLPPEAQRRYLEMETQVADFLADLLRAGVASGEFRQVDDRLMAHELILLAHMRALKGWALRGRDRNVVLEEHITLVLARLQPEAIR